MTSPIHERPAALADEERPSREDFLLSLNRLGANLGVRYYRASEDGTGIEEVQAVALSCTRDAWVGAFGEPEEIKEYHDTMTAGFLRSCHCWKQQCVEGVVKCIGRLFDRLPDGSRVIVLQARFSGCGQTLQANGEERGRAAPTCKDEPDGIVSLY